MSSKKFAQTLRLKILPSMQLAVFLLLTHAGAVMMITQVNLPLEAVAGLTVIVVYSLYTSFWRYVGLKSRHSIVEAVWESDGRWALMTAHGEVLDVDLLPTSTMFSALVLLNFRVHEKFFNRTLVITTDSVDPRSFRNLRVRLQLEPPG